MQSEKTCLMFNIAAQDSNPGSSAVMVSLSGKYTAFPITSEVISISIINNQVASVKLGWVVNKQ